ncbi:MAG: HAMP domain-containing sensor histidine kinase [Anaerolineales bacterium]|jgi:two-component system OmpR family sensor kinase
MSLRARLALLYTLIVGGILLLFGTAVYAAVSGTLNNQVNRNLIDITQTIIQNNRVDLLNAITMPRLDLSAEVYIQLFGRDKNLRFESVNLQARGFNSPLDEAGLNSQAPVFRDVMVDSTRLRVLSTPIEIAGTDRLVGYIQVATSLAALQTTQQILLIILLVGAVVSMLIAGLAGWVSTKRALSPLEAVTNTALQITRADDLSRRIPYRGPANDEVGQLINAFNQTLSRLENLFESQRRFLADVGHELRTPLTVIKGNVDLMRRMDCTDEESMQGIEEEVDRLTRLVGDLLLLAQAESGKLPLARITVELDTLLLDALHQMRVLAGERIQLKLGEIDQVLVCGDPDRLKQVLVNLIGNAIQYTPADGEVIVGLGKVQSQAHLTVSDTGPGIPPEDIPHIFERFYRGEKSRTRSKNGKKGFGLGLSIAYWIVRNHGGQIEVTPREPHGTTFSVWLPLALGECEEQS